MYGFSVTFLNQGVSYWKAASIRRAKKRLLYIVRNMNFITQILTKGTPSITVNLSLINELGTIVDIKESNSFASALMLKYFESATAFEQFYDELIYKKDLKQVRPVRNLLREITLFLSLRNWLIVTKELKQILFTNSRKNNKT